MMVEEAAAWSSDLRRGPPAETELTSRLRRLSKPG